jgi:trans-AT polyketide synthase/acyltransferase/oxidoreductase domain-containing protein
MPVRHYQTAYVFPGQGSQFLGMGGGLFDRYPEIEAAADQLLGYSIREICLEDPRRELSQTQFTQPALFTVNAMMYRAALADSGEGGDVMAGHSLGEYNALHAAGVFDFETGLRLVQKRGNIMSHIEGGAMAAVIGISSAEVLKIMQDNGISRLDIANENSPVQTVVSGLEIDVREAAKAFNAVEGCDYIPLRVSGAFHSRYMEAARDEFEDFMRQFKFSAPERVVISNVEARPYEADRTHELLLRQITHPVKWSESVQVMLGVGVDDFRESGPGDVLTKLVAATRQLAPALAIDWPI